MTSAGYALLMVAYACLAVQVSDYAARIARQRGPLLACLSLGASATALVLTLLPLIKGLVP